jgi:hypothetical protein
LFATNVIKDVRTYLYTIHSLEQNDFVQEKVAGNVYSRFIIDPVPSGYPCFIAYGTPTIKPGMITMQSTETIR